MGERAMAVAASASATRDDDGVHLSRPPPKGPTDAATTRVLALKRQKKSRKVRRMQQQQQRLLDCMFIAGLYHDKVTGEHRAYTREKFPVQFELPNNIGELCFPDLATWVPHSPGLTQTYMLVVTSRDGTRTFGYCRRIQPEGDELCLPLAVCILTKHRARGLFAKILDVVTSNYGNMGCSFKEMCMSLVEQRFPSLIGDSVAVRFGPDKFFEDMVMRPLDLRMEGAGIVSMLSADQLLMVLAAVMGERRLVVLASTLSDLTLFFDGLESLLLPLKWQHSLIPALPPAQKIFMEAPTPFLIGLLLNQQDPGCDLLAKWWRQSLKSTSADSSALFVLALGSKRSVILQRPVEHLPPLPKETCAKLRKGFKTLTEDRVRFLFVCESLKQEMLTLLATLNEFIKEVGDRRLFCVQDYVDSHLGNESVRSFLSSFSQTAMFGQFVRDTLSEEATTPALTRASIGASIFYA